MNKVAIITDSTVSIPPEIAEALNITIVPLSVNWDGQTLKDGIDITFEEFYKRLPGAKTLPTTSQPSMGDFANAYESLLSKGYDIFTLTLSSAISGTYDSAIQALAQFPDKNIKVFDSRVASVPATMAVKRVAKAAQRGASMLEIENIAKDICERVVTLFLVETLEYLHRGGRIGGAARLLGTALNLKPILTLVDGSITSVGKARTFKKGLTTILDMAEEDLGKNGVIDYLGIVTTDDTVLEQEILQLSKERFTINEIETGIISPVIGVHVGPGAIGFVYLPAL